MSSGALAFVGESSAAWRELAIARSRRSRALGFCLLEAWITRPFGEGLVGLARTEPSSALVVVCTHREVLLDVLPYLEETFQVKLGHRPPGAKGGVWLLEFRKKRLVRVTYRAT